MREILPNYQEGKAFKILLCFGILFSALLAMCLFYSYKAKELDVQIAEVNVALENQYKKGWK